MALKYRYLHFMFSIWEQETFFAPQDVVIAGSGFVGLWAAFFLKKNAPKLKVSVFDQGLIPTGASTRNAGFACFGSLSELVANAQAMGSEKMLELVEMRYKGLERIQKYFEKDVIDFELCGGYELYNGQDKNNHQLQENADYINSLLRPIIGTKRTFKIANEKITEFGFGGVQHLVKNNLEGYLHSGKLLQALLHKVQKLGVQVFTGTAIERFEQHQKGLKIYTSPALPICAKQLLICTNAFAKTVLPGEDIIPARGQVLLTSPIKNLPVKGTFHFDEGFYYFRNLGDRILLGGARNKDFEGERTTEFNTTNLIQNELEQFLNNIVLPNYRGKYTIEHRWSGIMAMGADKMPIIKEVQPQVFCAVRMSGMGVALAPIAGQQVAAMME